MKNLKILGLLIAVLAMGCGKEEGKTQAETEAEMNAAEFSMVSEGCVFKYVENRGSHEVSTLACGHDTANLAELDRKIASVQGFITAVYKHTGTTNLDSNQYNTDLRKKMKCAGYTLEDLRIARKKLRDAEAKPE